MLFTRRRMGVLALLLGGLVPSFAQTPQETATEPAPLLLLGQPLSATGQTYASTGLDTSAVTALEGATLALTDAKVLARATSSNEEASDLWGTNAAVLAAGGSLVTLTRGTVQTGGSGSAAVFSTGKDTKIVTTDVSVTTAKASSPGLKTTFGGTLVVNGGTVKTLGESSPGLASSGDLRVTGAVVVAAGSEAAVVEGPFWLTLTDTALVGSKKRGVLLSPASPDQASGPVFTMSGGSLTALEGPTFQATNTQAVVNLSQVTLVNRGVLVRGTAASVVVNADNQVLTGDLAPDALTKLSLNLRNGSSWTGTADAAQTGQVNVTLDTTSKWTVTADSRVTVLTVTGTDAAAVSASIVSGGHTVAYKATANAWLAGRTLALADGGTLRPY